MEKLYEVLIEKLTANDVFQKIEFSVGIFDTIKIRQSIGSV